MNFSHLGLAAAVIATIGLAGCQSERFARLDTRQPEPLQAAPAGNVTTTQLPPPAQPGVDPNTGFPTAPGAAETDMAADGTQMAALEQNAPEITTGSVAGVWNASVAGQSCRIATPQTRYGEGYRAGPLRCPAPLDGVKSWNVSGSQLALYDESGNVLARLYSTGAESFDGQTTTGQQVSLSR